MLTRTAELKAQHYLNIPQKPVIKPKIDLKDELYASLGRLLKGYIMMDFIKGFIYVIKGMSYLFTAGLKRFVLIPFLINILLFFSSLYLIYHYVFPYLTHYVDRLPSWLSFLSWAFLVVFGLSSFVLFLSLFTALFNLIAAPFNGVLAERAQNLIYKEQIPYRSIRQMILPTIKRQGQFLAYLVPRFIGMILLFFIPLIHPIYPLMWFVFTAWVLSAQFQDFVSDNNLISFKHMQSLMKEKPMVSLGFGFGINLFSFVPFINLFTFPAAVIGGVILFGEEYKDFSLKKRQLDVVVNKR